MECQHARLLLAFWRRPADGLDTEELAALREHLDGCPECSALAREERRTDGALGPVIRDVAVPEGLQQRILQKLAAQRRPFPGWRVAAAAAVVFLLIGVIGYSFYRQPAPLTSDDLAFAVSAGDSASADAVANWFDGQGFAVRPPRGFNYRDYFHTAALVPVKGRLVPMLLFYKSDRSAMARVYVVSAEQFKLDELVGGNRGSFYVFQEKADGPEVVYLVRHAGEWQSMLAPLQ